MRAAGGEVGGEHYNGVPRGYDVPAEREGLMRHQGLYAYAQTPVPAETHTPAFPRFCAGRWSALKPVQDWLVAEMA